MKIEHLRIENCQRLKLFELTPDKNLIIVGGDNAQGKTSVLESIKMLLGGKRVQVPEPVRHGASKAHIVATTDTGLKIEKEITPDGKEKLKISGPRDSNGQTLLNSIYNKHTIDPLAFSTLDKAKQRETLLNLVGVDPSEIDRKIKDIYDERTDINKNVREVDAQVANAPRYPDVSEDEISVSELAQEIKIANDISVQVENVKAELAALKAEKTRIKTRLEEIDTRGTLLRKTLNTTKAPDISKLEEKLSEIDNHNEKARANKTYTELKRRQKETVGASNRLSDQIEVLRAERVELLRAAKFPIPGLSFDDEQVFYNGIPFEQASSAEKLRVSTAIGIALQPELKVLLIRDGSLLDNNNLEMLRQMAEEHDAQIWLERVGHDEQATVIIEDGRIRENKTNNTTDIQEYKSGDASLSR